MANFIVVAVVLMIIGAAVAYIIKEKKHGVKCIGCPAAGTCPSSKGGQCSGGCHSNTNV
ncbi:MAG: FeoB-associated Cys-rich membrane protein [Lachnospiraceae bacterium]|nr:FeoB-associated Cys-rich membrane protein [Lachnospiraceae bacterium]